MEMELPSKLTHPDYRRCDNFWPTQESMCHSSQARQCHDKLMGHNYCYSEKLNGESETITGENDYKCDIGIQDTNNGPENLNPSVLFLLRHHCLQG